MHARCTEAEAVLAVEPIAARAGPGARRPPAGPARGARLERRQRAPRSPSEAVHRVERDGRTPAGGLELGDPERRPGRPGRGSSARGGRRGRQAAWSPSSDFVERRREFFSSASSSAGGSAGGRRARPAPVSRTADRRRVRRAPRANNSAAACTGVSPPLTVPRPNHFLRASSGDSAPAPIASAAALVLVAVTIQIRSSMSNSVPYGALSSSPSSSDVSKFVSSDCRHCE